MDSVAALVSGSARVAAATSSVLLVSNASSSSSSSSRTFDVNITAASSFPICSRRRDSLFLSSVSSGVVAAKRKGGLVWRKPLRCVAVDSTSTLEAAATAAAAVEPTSDDAIPIEKRFLAYPTVLDINQIREILPHRFPFLLVDRVIEYNPGVSVVAIKNVTINDNFFPGHFPERPIMPGVLMVEAMAQVGGIMMLQPDVGGSKESFFFAGVDKVRFRKPVVAGDTLVMRMNLVKLQKRFGIAKMEGKAYVGGEVVCEGEFLMALGKEE
ncbi:unnamed protein product [Sphagnum compactum]